MPERRSQSRICQRSWTYGVLRWRGVHAKYAKGQRGARRVPSFKLAQRCGQVVCGGLACRLAPIKAGRVVVAARRRVLDVCRDNLGALAWRLGGNGRRDVPGTNASLFVITLSSGGRERATPS